MLLTPVQIKPKLFELRQNSFFTRGGYVSCLRACLGARLLPQSYQYQNLLEDIDRVGGQLRGDKECPFSDVTKSGRVWRKVPENGARSVYQHCCHGTLMPVLEPVMRRPCSVGCACVKDTILGSLSKLLPWEKMVRTHTE